MEPIARTDLFEVADGGYRSVRIPALAVAPDGTLLSLVGGRRSVSDWADMDLLLRRSPDRGRTWTEPEIFESGTGETVDNPTFVVAGRTGAVHVVYQREYARLLHRRSDDNGTGFGPPADITAAADTFRERDGYLWNVVAPGPGTGVELPSGRLVVPVWLCDSGTKEHRPSIVGTIYSDDDGDTWQAGEIVVPNTPDFPNPSECVLLALPDGRVMINIRHESPAYRRAVSYSADGATGWSPPELVPELYDPICHASMTVLPAHPGRDRPVIAFVNPDSREQRHTIRPFGARPRENLTLHLSLDGGATWPVRKVLDPERSGYSAAAADPDGHTLHVTYERGYVPGNDLNTRWFSYLAVDVDDVLASGSDPVAGADPDRPAL